MRSIALGFACPAIQARSRHTCLSLSWAFSGRVVSSVQARDGHLFPHPRIATGRRHHGKQDGVGRSEAHVMTAMATSRFYNVPGSERLLSVARRRLFRPSKQLRMIGGCCVQPIVRRACHTKRRLSLAAYIADAMELFRCCYRQSEAARNLVGASPENDATIASQLHETQHELFPSISQSNVESCRYFRSASRC
jgi:hypothetical protein